MIVMDAMFKNSIDSITIKFGHTSLSSPKGVDSNYARSIHKDYFVAEKKQYGLYEEGIWDFNTTWKSVGYFPVYNGFLRAVRIGQKKLQRGLDIQCPVFLLCSDKKGNRSRDLKPHYLHSDCVLNPKHMTRHIHKIARNVTSVIIKDGLHDLALSPKAVREKYFSAISQWLNEIV